MLDWAVLAGVVVFVSVVMWIGRGGVKRVVDSVQPASDMRRADDGLEPPIIGLGGGMGVS